MREDFGTSLTLYIVAALGAVSAAAVDGGTGDIVSRTSGSLRIVGLLVGVSARERTVGAADDVRPAMIAAATNEPGEL